MMSEPAVVFKPANKTRFMTVVWVKCFLKFYLQNLKLLHAIVMKVWFVSRIRFLPSFRYFPKSVMLDLVGMCLPVITTLTFSNRYSENSNSNVKFCFLLCNALWKSYVKNEENLFLIFFLFIVIFLLIRILP